jgi:ribosomal protein S12 methylthiotransferase accessory factor
LQSTSTGAACHVDRERAILSALYECIERDAVMIAWLNRLALPVIDTTTMHRASLEETLARLARHGLTGRLFDATSDVGIPTALCVLYGPTTTIPSLAVGAASHSTLAEASEKALIESAHTLYWIHTRSRENGLQRFRHDYSDVTSLDMHSLLYGDPRMRDKVAFLGGDVAGPVRGFKANVPAREPQLTDGTVAGELGHCLSALHRLGLEAVVVDMTPSDVAEIGFVVVRVVVTELHPLWGGHHVRCLGGRRVREVPVRLGYSERARATSEFNTDPHPMP